MIAPACDSSAIRASAEGRKTWANIPVGSNRKGAFAFSARLCRRRNLVERVSSRIRQFRGNATRYDKDPRPFLAAVNSSLCASGAPCNESAA
jgi:transposase